MASYQDKVLRPDTLGQNVLQSKYAVRGEIYLAAQELVKQGREVVFTNVGNPHSLGQKPLTFPRQVVALCQAPFLLENPRVGELFPAEAIERARAYLKMMGGGTGAYSDSRGVPGIRREVADFIERRDGHPSNPELIYLTDGASVGVKTCLQLLIRNNKDGILVPVPQYPLYSATITLLGGNLVPYYLAEDQNWGMNIQDIHNQVKAARAKGISVRGLVMINPGNPTGTCLSEDNLRDMIRFCADEKIVLLADEVYQENVYQRERPFVSCKKVLMDMGPPSSRSLELISFHTVSKGAHGECGQRGGYFEMTNMHPAVVEEVYKLCSIGLCPNLTGQLFMGLMCNPPPPHSEAGRQYYAEKEALLGSLERRAQVMSDGFNKCTNMTCNTTEGALYSFPRIHLPPGAIAAAKQAGKAPDTFYCLELLKATGISTVPGSGFGQQDGTFHFRTTILPQEELVPELVQRVKVFNDRFMDKYSARSAL